MNRTYYFLKNTFVTALYQACLMITGFLLPKIMLTFYGSEINGLVSSVTQFINYITLVEAGLSGATVYALYKPLADKDRVQISGIVVAAKKFYTISGWIFTLLVVLLAIIYPWFVTSEHLSYLDILLLVLIIGTSGTIDFFLLGKYRAILTADQKQYVISVSSLLYCVLNTALIAIFAVFGFNVVAARLGALSAVALRSIMIGAFCKKHYAYLDFHQKPITSALNKRWDALFLQILGVIHSGSPIALATVFTSLKEVSVYAVFNVVANGVASILGIFTTGVGAGFGDLIARKEEKALKRAYSDFEFMYYMLIAFVYSVMMIQIMPFINLYTAGLSDADYSRPLLGFLFTLNGFLYSLKTPQGMMVISAGLYKETKWQTVIQAVIAVVGGGVLGKLFGLPGILVGMCLSNLYRDIDLCFFIPKHVTGLPVMESIKSAGVAVLGFIAISAIGFQILLQCNTYVDWIGNSILMCTLAAAILMVFAFALRKALLIQSVTRVLGIIKSKVGK